MSGAQSTGVHVAFSTGYQGGSIKHSLMVPTEGGSQHVQTNRDGISHACCCEIRRGARRRPPCDANGCGRGQRRRGPGSESPLVPGPPPSSPPQQQPGKRGPRPCCLRRRRGRGRSTGRPGVVRSGVDRPGVDRRSRLSIIWLICNKAE